MDRFEVCIAGAGVIGLAIARHLARSKRFSAGSIVIVDQETDFGRHTSSRNSEVIHAGIYYPQGSLKAQLCLRGKQQLYEYCETNNIPFSRTGKCIITTESHTDSLEKLEHRALLNGVDDLHLWSQSKVAEEEPAVSATAALFSPSTGIVDSHQYMQCLLHEAEAAGVIFARSTRIESVELAHGGFRVHTRIPGKPGEEAYSFASDVFINSAGLQAQDLARVTEGVKEADIPRLYPCKGDYFAYSGKNPFRHLIYPLPEPNTQGLGVHSTTDMSGQLRFGPDTEYVHEIDYAMEASKSREFAAAIARYFPAVEPDRLAPGYSGIRPKLAGPGMAVADFEIQTPETHGLAGLVQLFGIESPGLTSSLAIAEYIEARL